MRMRWLNGKKSRMPVLGLLLYYIEFLLLCMSVFCVVNKFFLFFWKRFMRAFVSFSRYYLGVLAVYFCGLSDLLLPA